MKKFFTFLLIALGCSLHGQDSTEYIDIGPNYDNEPIETFQSGNYHNGGFFGLDFRYGQIEGENAAFGGGKAAYIMNRSLEIGVAGMLFYSEQENILFEDSNLGIGGGYGGLYVAPVIKPLKKVHLSIPIVLGAGAVGYDEDIRGQQGRLIHVDDWDEIFMVQGGLNLVFNVTSFFQAEIGLHYLHTTDIELDMVRNLDITGLTGGFGLRFGRF